MAPRIPNGVCQEVIKRSNDCSEVSHQKTGEKLVFLQLLRGEGVDFLNRCNLMRVTEYEVLGFYIYFWDRPEDIRRTKEEVRGMSLSLASKLTKINILDKNARKYDKKLQAAVDAWREYFKEYALPAEWQLNEVTVDSRLRRPRAGFLTNVAGLRR